MTLISEMEPKMIEETLLDESWNTRNIRGAKTKSRKKSINKANNLIFAILNKYKSP